MLKVNNVVSRSMLSLIKSGARNPSFTTALLLAQEYGCSIDYLAQCLDEHRLPDKPKPAPLIPPASRGHLPEGCAQTSFDDTACAQSQS